MNPLLKSVLGFNEDRIRDAVAITVRAVAWARVSTDMQEERGLSIPEQLRQIREYAEQKGIEIVEEYHEAASAFKKESLRVEFHKMLAHAKSDRSVSAILVHDYSRFSRDSLGARMLVRELRQAGIRVISLNDLEVDPESVAGVYVEAITFAKNEAYSREVAFHTKKGCRANVQTRDPETSWCYKNGGQPLWGYRAERLMRGEIKKGRPLIKCIWVPDDRIVAGKSIYEWAQYCLTELAAKGATLDQLRDFCNKQGIPAPRQQFWGHTTWNSLLHPHCLLQYAGYGVWNVRGKAQRVNPPSDWVIVENAHQPLITEEVARQIIDIRAGRKCSKFTRTSNRTHSSRWLLSGGLFTCERCGSNLIGMDKGKEAQYYVCGSQPHRRGLGCGPAVYIPQREIEQEVLAGLQNLISVCSDPKGFTKQVNEELKRIWEDSTGHDPSVPSRISEIDAKLANIRKAVEEGLPDSSWAYTRMKELLSEKDSLSSLVNPVGDAPQINIATAMAYRKQTEKVLAQGTNAERKQMLKSWVDHIQLTPETLEVDVHYRIPEQLVNSMGAVDEVVTNYPSITVSNVEVKRARRRNSNSSSI